MEPGHRLKVAIVTTGRKQRDIAAALSLSETDLSRYITTSTQPRAELAVRIANELGTTVEAIWGAKTQAAA